MGLLNKEKKKKPLRISGSAGLQQSPLRPRLLNKRPPCVQGCPIGTDIRGWITRIAQREKLGLARDEAYRQAFRALVETNPFPSMMGRICPHPCEAACTRTGKDGAVAIHAAERFLGDWALEHRLPLPRVEGEERKQESIGVVGAGPAGLSFAYQMARRGYPVTVYDQNAVAGGMVRYGIPFYRQPADVLHAEIQRIFDLGVEIRPDFKVGQDISLDELRARHRSLFLGIGAHKGRRLGCPGEDGPGVWAGTDYLRRVKDGEKIDVGRRSAVIGGGDTAIDAARMARRSGAEVVILYRRTRADMPAIPSEIEDAEKEDIRIAYLVAPVEIRREGDRVRSIALQQMELGEPDESGRRRPVPIAGSEHVIPVDSVIAAISQEADWSRIEGLGPEGWRLEPDERFQIGDGVYAAGDAIALGIAATAIGQGRIAAEACHAELRGLSVSRESRPDIAAERVRANIEEVYPSKPRAEQPRRPVGEWLARPDDEIALRIPEERFLDETTRCLSCGQCFGCERCWMYCTPSCFSKISPPVHGEPYYAVDLAKCDGCKKCGEECPSGFIDLV